VDSREPSIQAYTFLCVVKKKIKKRNTIFLPLVFHRFRREIIEPQRAATSRSGIGCQRPLEVTRRAWESCFLRGKFLVVSWTVLIIVFVFYPSSCHRNKALERFLVFTGARMRPGRGRSPGGGEARCGRPWDNLASAPVRSPRRCP